MRHDGNREDEQERGVAEHETKILCADVQQGQEHHGLHFDVVCHADGVQSNLEAEPDASRSETMSRWREDDVW